MKLAYILVAVLTFYAAGMFRSAALMAVCAAELAVFVVMLILSRVLKRGVSLSLGEPGSAAFKGERLALTVSAVNSRGLPAPRVRAAVNCSFGGKTVSGRVSGSVAGRGAERFGLALTPERCGIYTISAGKARVSDYISLFSPRVKFAGESELAVFPTEKRLKIAFRAADSTAADAETETPRGIFTGDDHDRLREYRAGDPSRHIHRNLSARTGELWIRDGEPESDRIIALSLGSPPEKSGDRDAFFELASALALGLLECAAAVRASADVFDGEPAIERELRSADDVRALLLSIYRAKRGKSGTIRETSGDIRLDSSLGLYSGGELVHRFSRRAYISELSEREFTL